MDVSYLRYQDDIIVLCKTKRQLERAKQRMLSILKTRHLSLSRKKTRLGRIDAGFHFLGIQYPGTQPSNTHHDTQGPNGLTTLQDATYLTTKKKGGGRPVNTIKNQSNLGQQRIVPHPRTLRNAREQAKQTVLNGASLQQTKRYLARWCSWWVQTTGCWSYNELLTWFSGVYWDKSVKAIAESIQDASANDDINDLILVQQPAPAAQ